MKETLIRLSLFLQGVWYSQDGEIMYQFDPTNDNLEGDLHVLQITSNRNSSYSYKIWGKDNELHLILDGKDNIIDQIDENELWLSGQTKPRILLRKRST